MDLARFPSSSNPPLENFPFFEHLPAELALKIFSYLPSKEVYLATRVCSLFNQYCRDESLWKFWFACSYPFETLREGETALERCVRIAQADLNKNANIRNSRYAIEEITFNRENAPANSHWMVFKVYQDRVYAATNQKTVEIWDLNSRKKATDDLPLQAAGEPLQIIVNRTGISVRSKYGVDSFGKDGENPCLTPTVNARDCRYFVTDNVALLGMPGQSKTITIGPKAKIESQDGSPFLSFFAREDTVYALTDTGFLERWDLFALTPLEKVDVKKDGKKPCQIVGVGKNGEVVIQYAVVLNNHTRSKHGTMISWNLEENTVIKEVKIKSSTRFFTSGNFLFCDLWKGVVEVRELATLEIKSRLMPPEMDFFLERDVHCDGHKLYFPKRWDWQTKSHTLEVIDFLPAEGALEDEDQIALHQTKEKRINRAVRYQEVEDLGDPGAYDSYGDCFLGILSALGFGCMAVAMDVFEYLWDRFCDLTEWVSSFFDEGEEEAAVPPEIIPPLPILPPDDRPADNNGNNI